MPRQGVFDKYIVTTERIVHTKSLADRRCRRPEVIDFLVCDKRLDLILNLIRQLEAFPREHFHPVVLEWVMGRRDHHPSISPQTTGEESNAWGRYGSDEKHIYPHRADA